MTASEGAVHKIVGGKRVSMPGRRAGQFALSSYDHLMLLSPQRVFYAGLLGRPRNRTSGALYFYVSVEGRLTLSREDGKVERDVTMAIVPPYVAHTVEADHLTIINILVEPETLRQSTLAAILAQFDQKEVDFVARVRAAYYQCLAEGGRRGLSPEAFDTLFFGKPLPSRKLDPRIARAVRRIDTFDGDSASAADCAAEGRISLSRFAHLFKQETGISFRVMRAWKRARHLLHFVNTDHNLAHLAQEIGYPDSTHFSRSIRRYHGLRPRTIFRGSRDLEIVRSNEMWSPAGASRGYNPDKA